MENYPIVSPKRKTQTQFRVFTDQAVCEEIVKKFDELIAEMNIKTENNLLIYNDTTGVIYTAQQEQFRRMFLQSPLSDIDQSQDMAENLQAYAGKLVNQFAYHVQQLVSVTQKNLQNIQNHFQKQGAATEFAYSLDHYRVHQIEQQLERQLEILKGVENNQHQQMFESLFQGTRTLDSLQKEQLRVYVDGVQAKISQLIKNLKFHVSKLEQETNLLDLALKQYLNIFCPCCRKTIEPENLLICLFPCGHGICQQCYLQQYKQTENEQISPDFSCYCCNIGLEAAVIDGLAAQRVSDEELSGKFVIKEIRQMCQECSQIIKSLTNE